MPELPTTFGKYFLTEKLATGGMAEIYLAKIVGPGGFEKQLVIKQIHPQLSHQRHFVDLFVAEAKTLVTLAHGNIVPVYELGVVDDTYFIVMEYIDGPTLYRLTETLARRDAKMEPATAAWIAARILEGLDYAHRKGEGVIHRDLSPRNVMLSRDGEVKLVDFGIAVTLGAASDDDQLHSAPTGSFPYMSPEQVRKEPLTGQSDLFSVGVLLWEMLTGQRLFARSDADATLAAVTDGDITPPSSVRAEIPAKLETVVMRALERDTTSRWRAAGEMLAELQRYLYTLEQTPGPRDVAALVARYCPAETRRLPTHSDGVVGDTDLDITARSDRSGPLGPRTAVVPRGARGPLGKRPPRHQSFATHVQLKDLLERATPMFPISAIQDNGGDAPSSATPSKLSDASLEANEHKTPAWLILVALGALILAIAAVVMFVRGQHAVLAPDASQVADAAAPPTRDASLLAVPADAAPSLTDAAADAPADAGVGGTMRDAGVRLRPDSGAVATTSGTATLRIGANPWGEIVIDGKPSIANGAPRRTPAELTISAGRHVVDIVFRGEDPPRKKTFTIEVTTGELKELSADFTTP
ncbi:MAG: serine/threonine protein kinase [Kofleriaceae bacterium]